VVSERPRLSRPSRLSSSSCCGRGNRRNCGEQESAWRSGDVLLHVFLQYHRDGGREGHPSDVPRPSWVRRPPTGRRRVERSARRGADHRTPGLAFGARRLADDIGLLAGRPCPGVALGAEGGGVPINRAGIRGAPGPTSEPAGGGSGRAEGPPSSVSASQRAPRSGLLVGEALIPAIPRSPSPAQCRASSNLRADPRCTCRAGSVV
jgi:hypothetical protein